jgi:hypothetical protein
MTNLSLEIPSQFHFLEIFIKIFNVTVEEFFNLFL